MATIKKSISANWMGLPLNIKRGNPVPLDATDIWFIRDIPQGADAATDVTSLKGYAKNDPTAYVGQILTYVPAIEVSGAMVSQVDDAHPVEVYVIKNTAGDVVKIGASPDGKSLVEDVQRGLELYGFNAASVGQVARKGADGNLEWSALAASDITGLDGRIETVVTVDGKSIERNIEGKLALKGVAAAATDTVPSKQADGTIAWVSVADIAPEVVTTTLIEGKGVDIIDEGTEGSHAYKINADIDTTKGLQFITDVAAGEESKTNDAKQAIAIKIAEGETHLGFNDDGGIKTIDIDYFSGDGISVANSTGTDRKIFAVAADYAANNKTNYVEVVADGIRSTAALEARLQGIETNLSGIHSFEYVVYPTLPTASADTMYKIALVADTSAESGVYVEYITVRTGSGDTATYAWEQIGTTKTDLSEYALKTDLLTHVDGDATKVTKTGNNVAINVEYDGATIKKNSQGKLYADITIPDAPVVGVADGVATSGSLTADKKVKVDVQVDGTTIIVNDSNQLTAVIPEIPEDYVKAITDTNSIDLTVTNGALKADAVVSNKEHNAMQVLAAADGQTKGLAVVVDNSTIVLDDNKTIKLGTVPGLADKLNTTDQVVKSVTSANGLTLEGGALSYIQQDIGISQVTNLQAKLNEIDDMLPADGWKNVGHTISYDDDSNWESPNIELDGSGSQIRVHKEPTAAAPSYTADTTIDGGLITTYGVKVGGANTSLDRRGAHIGEAGIIYYNEMTGENGVLIQYNEIAKISDLQDAIDAIPEIPGKATTTELGLVLSSESTEVNNVAVDPITGKMTVNDISTDKLVNGSNTLVLAGGNASGGWNPIV